MPNSLRHCLISFSTSCHCGKDKFEGTLTCNVANKSDCERCQIWWSWIDNTFGKDNKSDSIACKSKYLGATSNKILAVRNVNGMTLAKIIMEIMRLAAGSA